MFIFQWKSRSNLCAEGSWAWESSQKFSHAIIQYSPYINDHIEIARCGYQSSDLKSYWNFKTYIDAISFCSIFILCLFAAAEYEVNFYAIICHVSDLTVKLKWILLKSSGDIIVEIIQSSTYTGAVHSVFL